jgi:hypothetical protein
MLNNCAFSYPAGGPNRPIDINIAPSMNKVVTVLLALASFAAILTQPWLFVGKSAYRISLFFPDPGVMGRSMQERNFLRERSGQDFQTVQNEFTVRRSDLYGNRHTYRPSSSERRAKSVGKFQSLALAKSNSPPRVQLPAVHIRPDPIVSMAIHDMQKGHARRYNSQVSPIIAFFAFIR